MREMHDRDNLFAVAYLATACPKTAAEQVRQAGGNMATLVRELPKILPRRTAKFDQLDSLLRANTTTALDAEQPVNALRWELKRTCLALVLQCVSVGPRLAFILVDVLGISQRNSMELLNIKETALHVRLTRVRLELDDYLGPRCGHLQPGNPCTCTGRVGVALNKGVIRLPTIPVPQRSHASHARNIQALYRDLPISWPSPGPSL